MRRPKPWKEFQADRNAEVVLERAYDSARLEDRARLLREYIAAGGSIRVQRIFADGLALDAGFSREEIKEMRHLVDGESPAGGWCGIE